MAEVMETVDVKVPVRTAYNQWTQFEQFPQFMEGVEQVQQLDDTHLHWIAEFGGKRAEWDAEITEQLPDERVAWTARSGKGNAGVVTFHRLNEDETRVTVQMDWQPEGVVENVGTALGFDDRQVRSDLGRFKELIETRGTETGAWRGEVDATSAPRSLDHDDRRSIIGRRSLGIRRAHGHAKRCSAVVFRPWLVFILRRPLVRLVLPSCASGFSRSPSSVY